MKKDRALLEENLLNVIDTIKSKTKILALINRSLTDFGVAPGTINEIVRREKSLSSLDVALLCLVSFSVYNVVSDSSISPYDYFSDGEIEESKKKYLMKDSGALVTLPLDISDVIMVDLDNYITKIKMSLLVEMYHSKLIEYNYDTQRSAKYKKSKDGVVPVPDINKKSVQDISEHMLNETYLSDMITLNVYSTEVEALEYNEKTKTLTINSGSIISILDGFHRLQGGVRAVAINPDLELEMILSIRNYDIDTAKKYFGQINTINVIKPERLRELKSEKHSDLVVRDLQKKSDLKGKIASSSNISKIAGQLTTFDILSYAIDTVFAPKTTLEAKKVSNYLIEFFNYLVGSFVEEFLINPDASRKTYINHPLMFAGYVQIAKNFQEKEIKLITIKNYVDNINFEDVKLIEIFGDRRGINNKRTRNKIIEYFKVRG